MDDRFGIGLKLHVISNGYDPEELAAVEPYDFGHFAIVYAGNFYPPKRVISPVIAALGRLKQVLNGKGPEWFFHYYGGQEDHVRAEARQFGVIDRVVLHGRVPRSSVLSATRGAGMALVITSVAEENALEDRGIVPGKLFEILGLGTPMLLIAPQGSDVDTITATTNVGRRFTGSDIEGMTSFLMDVIRGRALEPKAQKPFAWTNIASCFDVVLRKAMSPT
jgi:glycosyltransferase involved in cell wall biosynthesis